MCRVPCLRPSKFDRISVPSGSGAVIEPSNEGHSETEAVLQAKWISSSMDRRGVAGVATLEILALFEQLRTAWIADLDALFAKLMTIHRVGAVKMADEEIRGGSDIRLRVMAHGIAP